MTTRNIYVVSSRGGSSLTLSTPRTLGEVSALFRAAIVKHGGDASALVVSHPMGTDTIVVNL